MKKALILKRDKDVIVEKPLTEYFRNDEDDFNGDTLPGEKGLEHALQSVRNILEAERSSKGTVMYAEN